MVRGGFVRVVVCRRRLERLVREGGRVERHEDGDLEQVELAVAGLRHGMTRDFGIFEGEVLVLGLDIGRVS